MGRWQNVLLHLLHLSDYAPKIITLSIPVDKIRDVICSEARLSIILQDTGVTIDIEEDGRIYRINGQRRLIRRKIVEDLLVRLPRWRNLSRQGNTLDEVWGHLLKFFPVKKVLFMYRNLLCNVEKPKIVVHEGWR